MKGLDSQIYIILLIISNIVAIAQLIASVKWPRIARISFFLLFAWASWTNWKTSQQTPHFYLDYADLTWSEWYRTFIHGWFAQNIKIAVGFIAICQGLMALSMLLKGWIFKLGSIGAILFLVSILPFGVGSGFPCTAIMAAAIYILWKKHDSKFVWENKKWLLREKAKEDIEVYRVDFPGNCYLLYSFSSKLFDALGFCQRRKE